VPFLVSASGVLGGAPHETHDHAAFPSIFNVQHRDDDLRIECHVVTLDGKRLEMLAGETEQEHIMALEKGELMLQWEQHRIGVGQAVEITSGDH
jgi:hypothetical protein